MTLPRRLVILGATGTVGVQALQILKDSSSPLQVVAISCHHRLQELKKSGPENAQHFQTSHAVERDALLDYLRQGDYEVCLNAVVGAAGLPYTEAVLQAGRTLALANKESLVMAGGLLTELARQNGAEIVPVDSEHSAIHQCLRGARYQDIRKLYLTASGGALRDTPRKDLADVSPAQALAHPNWAMGPRITIDSATMMNKAFEIIEAHYLFQVAAPNIRVLLHRQSVVHSMVEFHDGSLLAQMGPPDMRLPIHDAIHYPQRFPSPLRGFDAKIFSQLTFEDPDQNHYPALTLGWQAAAMGGDAGSILNAADEVAVAAFLDGRISFPKISSLCQQALEKLAGNSVANLNAVYAADQKARDFVADLLLKPH